MFGSAPGKELRDAELPAGAFIQYVDGVLVCSPAKEDSDHNTVLVLNFLAQRGYRVSPQKAQISQQQVSYLGYDLTPAHGALSVNRKTTILELGPPKTTRQLGTFLGVAGLSRSWLPQFKVTAKSLHESTRGHDREPLEWTRKEDKVF